MPVLDEVLQQKLALLDAKKQRRALRPSAREGGVIVRRAGRDLVSFSCNDYLGLSHHPEVQIAAQQAITVFGAGAGASRLITGSHPLYAELELLLANMKNTHAACVFGSGYLANIGVIPALVGAGDLIIADRLSHACMLDAAKLSGATLMRFAHNNMEHLMMLLEANRHEYQNCLILSETIFSMDGDRAPIKALEAIAAKFDSWLMTDAAHDLFTATTNHQSPATIQMGTLSKAVGSYGGYVCGSEILIDYIKTSARSLIYSTALPPAVIAASIAALTIIKTSPKLSEKALRNAQLFTSLMQKEPAVSGIVPVILKDNDKVLSASKYLEDQGFLVAAIRPPTVPENTARLRFAFSALHTAEQIVAVTNILKEKGWV